MPRTSRMIIAGEKAVYHVMSRTALDGYPLKDVEISRISRFRYRTRYFTDSGIIGSKQFVSENYQRFKHLFYSKHEKKPKPIKGLDGMYSLSQSNRWNQKSRLTFHILVYKSEKHIVYNWDLIRYGLNSSL